MTLGSMNNKKNPARPSDAQKERFRAISGRSLDGSAVEGTFTTPHAFTGPDGASSPWHCAYWFNPDTGHLRCRLSHRDSNDRYYAWDHDGNEVLVPDRAGVRVARG